MPRGSKGEPRTPVLGNLTRSAKLRRDSFTLGYEFFVLGERSLRLELSPRDVGRHSAKVVSHFLKDWIDALGLEGGQQHPDNLVSLDDLCPHFYVERHS